jgi:hypothetical protein
VKARIEQEAREKESGTGAFTRAADFSPNSKREK